MKRAQTNPLFYSVRSFADAFDISDRTVWRLIAAGKIKTVRLSERRVGIPKKEAEHYAAMGFQLES